MGQASNKLFATLTATALFAALGVPAHQTAYGIDSEQNKANESSITQNDNADEAETSVPDNETPQSDGITDDTSTLAAMVRTANSTSETISQDARAVPSTVAVALGLAAVALVFVAFRVKA